MPEKKKTGYPSVDKTHLEGIPEKVLHPRIIAPSILATFLLVNRGRMDEIAVNTVDEQFTKQEVKELAVRVAAGLLRLGLRAGDKIAIVTPNCIEGIVTVLGANAIGIQVAMLDPTLREEQLLEKLELHKPQAVLTYGKTLTDSVVMRMRRPELRYVIEVMPRPQTTDRYVSFDELVFARRGTLERAQTLKELTKHALGGDEPLLYLQTSGTSAGKPKTMMFSNRNIFASLIYISNNTGTQTNDTSVNKVLCILPYRLPYGWMTIFHNLMGGNQVVLAPGAEPEDIGRYYELEPSYIYGTPMIFRVFMEETPAEADLSFVVKFFCSGFGMAEEWWKRGKEYFAAHNAPDAQVCNNYGIGEGFCIGSYPDDIPHKPGTSGKLYAGVDWLIVDENLQEVKYSEIGELLTSSAALCHGYLDNPEGTAAAFIELDGKVFYRTGDMVSLDEDGYVTVLGRGKRTFMPVGATDKVYCEAIERALMSLDAVWGAAVVVKEDDRGMETAKAFVVPADDLTQDEVQTAIGAGLPELLQDFQLPQEIVFIDEIPLMSSGKIDYTLLETM